MMRFWRCDYCKKERRIEELASIVVIVEAAGVFFDKDQETERGIALRQYGGQIRVERQACRIQEKCVDEMEREAFQVAERAMHGGES